ncbi:MAG: hypothetical protein JW940_06260 [Polyangiaceae bacterium]|nr:hypothetical protein [Polyangiaceae bacterium]
MAVLQREDQTGRHGSWLGQGCEDADGTADTRGRTVGTGDERDSQQRPPAISVPKNGGSIRGIGEKFAETPVMGSGSKSVPLALSPGRTGSDRQLSPSNDSGNGNGPFGFN